jgi:hypothetical protein
MTSSVANRRKPLELHASSVTVDLASSRMFLPTSDGLRASLISDEYVRLDHSKLRQREPVRDTVQELMYLLT